MGSSILSFIQNSLIKRANQQLLVTLFRHIDHISSLGGVNQIGFGSDFDGIDLYIKDLEDSSKFQNLINELQKRYSEDEVRGFAYQNFLNNRPKLRSSK